ncbi:hypothetical protein D9758_013893 [Tetrapyrgos nigripes]|uniref:F-box domain-containing protein n=1 Tax=Tetrapyrgos nigripes TaxID=182062 RepID=A0A8H5CPC4_9AGAR|nr:hypothetical protein D9758_013893 [Tetrapyrgos nigripes]
MALCRTRPELPVELIELVFDQLNEKALYFHEYFLERDWMACQRNLLSCALSCRAFRELALRALWYTMNTLMPLLRLLPNFRLIDGIYVLDGDFDEASLERFDFYATMVKDFRLKDLYETNQFNTKINDSVYFRLLRKRPQLLPSLTYFEYRDNEMVPCHMVSMLFISPLLKDVYLAVGYEIEDEIEDEDSDDESEDKSAEKKQGHGAAIFAYLSTKYPRRSSHAPAVDNGGGICKLLLSCRCTAEGSSLPQPVHRVIPKQSGLSAIHAAAW